MTTPVPSETEPRSPEADFGLPVDRRVVEIEGVAMSARIARAPRPRAVVVALHGGSVDSAYFDCPGHPRLSLLRTASALGFTAVALDRPGYGASAPHAESFHDPRRRSELAYALIDRLVPPGARGAGIALLAHSAGCEPAVRMAAEPRGASLLGVSLAGTGLRHPPDTAARLAAARERKTPTKVRDLLWEPARLHPSDVIGGAGMLFPSPAYEGDVVDTWAARDFAALAARVRVPVQFVHAEHENVWQSDPDSLAEVAALFRAAPRVELVEQRGAGHNLSVAHTATAYHLKVLSFVEECVVARGLGETDTAGFGKALS